MRHHGGDRVAFEMAESFTFRAGADEARIAEDVRGGAVNLGVEIGFDLEDLPELLIVRGQHEVRHRISGDDELDVERNRLGPQGLRSQEPILLHRVLEADFFRSDCAFETFPRARLHHDVHEVDDEVAAIRQVNRPRLEHGVVADIRAEVGAPFDPAEEVCPAGVRLDDDGRGLGVRVINEDVTAKRPEGIGLNGRSGDCAHRGCCNRCCLLGLRAQDLRRGKGEFFELRQEVNYFTILFVPL